MKLLSMSGFVPEQICDIIRFTKYKGERSITHYCGYASDFISQVIQDDEIDGAVYPRSCDSSRILSDYLCETGKFLYQMHIPPRQDESAIYYFTNIVKDYKVNIERYFHVAVYDNDVRERTEYINQRNKRLQEIYKDIGSVSYAKFLNEIHRMLQNPLKDQYIPTNLNKKECMGKRVFIVGSFLSNIRVIEAIEEAGMSVEGDNLTESSRLFMAPRVELSGDIYYNIAKSILSNRLSPTQGNFKQIIENDMQMINEKDIKGVIFVTQKYCEPYDYLFSVYKKALDEKGIPNIKINLSDTEGVGKIELVMESFADIL